MTSSVSAPPTVAGRARTSPEAPVTLVAVPPRRLRRRARRLLGALLMAMACLPAGAVGQVSLGDYVRIHDSEGERVASGRVVRITEDSLVLDARANRWGGAFPADAFQGSLWLTVRGGTKVGSTARAFGVGGALMGAAFGYCVELYSNGCAESLNGAVVGGVILGGMGAALGAVIGVFRSDWQGARFEPGGAVPGVRVVPVLATDGRFGLAASLRF